MPSNTVAKKEQRVGARGGRGAPSRGRGGARGSGGAPRGSPTHEQSAATAEIIPSALSKSDTASAAVGPEIIGNGASSSSASARPSAPGG